jgi:hypothetical protein
MFKVAIPELAEEDVQLVTLHLNWLPSIAAVIPVTVSAEPDAPDVHVVLPLLLRSLHDPDELFRLCQTYTKGAVPETETLNTALPPAEVV